MLNVYMQRHAALSQHILRVRNPEALLCRLLASRGNINIRVAPLCIVRVRVDGQAVYDDMSARREVPKCPGVRTLRAPRDLANSCRRHKG